MTMTDWSNITRPSEVAGALIALYADRGDHRYDEAVTQLDHARQCGSLALAAGAEDSTVVAAFLHDIGHLLADEQPANDRDRRHEHVGARFLSRWFRDDVVEPVRLYVAAKRFLCSVEPGYGSALSPASVRSLELQGGPMGPVDRERFGRERYGPTAVELRRWDEQAKVPSTPTPEPDVFGSIIEDVLAG